MGTDVLIRMAKEEDAEELLNIYAYYVVNTAVTFEYEVPSVSEFSQRIRNTLEKYPYLVALDGEGIAGYAYASAFRERAAYSRSVETSVYLRQDHRGYGIGKKLYTALEDILKHQNILNIYAGTAYTLIEDTHLNNASMAFHEHLGYSKAAHFIKCGYKFGTWYDLVWMEKHIGAHLDTPEPFIPITKIKHGS